MGLSTVGQNEYVLDRARDLDDAVEEGAVWMWVCAEIVNKAWDERTFCSDKKRVCQPYHIGPRSIN